MTQKTNRLHFSTRTVAMVLSIVMLIGSIATGSMLNTFAAYMKDAAAKSDALSQAATEGGDIALNAIPSEDQPDLSGFKESGIVRGLKQNLIANGVSFASDPATITRDKGSIAVTGANADLASTGFGTNLWFKIKGAWDDWKDHWVEPGTTITIDLTKQKAGSDVEFSLNVNENGTDYYFNSGANIYTQNGKDYTWNTGSTSNNKFHVVKPCKITAKLEWVNEGGSAKLTVTNVEESTAAQEWYLIGGDNWGKWETTNKDNPFTLNSSTGYFEKKITVTGDTYFRVHDGTKQYMIGSANTALTANFQTMSEYSSGNVALEVTKGSYTLQIDSANKKIRALVTTKSTLTVPTVANAVVTASYNGTIAQEGQTITNVPSGALVDISVTPTSTDTQHYKCSGVTGTNSATVTGSGNSYTLTMPANDASFNVSITTTGTKRIYYNNYTTKYAMVSAYAWLADADGTVTAEPLGPWAGSTMTKIPNTSTWYIDVPEYVTNITFIGDNNVNTGPLTFPTDTNDQYNPNTKQWVKYTERDNVYTVTDGTTMNDPNLFTGVTATFYDYFVDGEAAAGNWISGIKTTDPNEYGGGSNFKYDPYTTLNGALSQYAIDNSVTYPLYFGDFNRKNVSGAGSNYHNFNYPANNANGLDAMNNAVTGLSGTTLANSNIHYYSGTGGATQNGAIMAMFDEDFLSGENNAGKPLATILRSSTFPVRKSTEGATTTYENKLYLDPGVWNTNSAWYAAYFYGNGDTWRKLEADGNYFSCEIPSGYTHVIFVRMNKDKTDLSWDSKWNQTEDLTYTTDTGSANRLYTITGWGSDKSPCTQTDISSDYGTTSGGHTKYEYDSTGGKDNAFITNIDKSGKTAKIDYYENQNQVKSVFDKMGFFPFDYNNISGKKSTISESGYADTTNHFAHDQGFGVKLEIPFRLEANGLNADGTHQKFDFSGDDDLWVFVDDKLVLDLGGSHAMTTGNIDFNTMTATADHKQKVLANVDRNGSFSSWFNNTNPNIPHKMTIYYMERGMFDSNLKFGFSFHAIPEQYKTEKKVRTANINSGFYVVNDTTRSSMTIDDGRAITKFEETYQDEKFDIEHKVDGTLINGKTYSINGTEATSSGTYQLKNDQIAYFVGQFADDKDKTFTLKETDASTNHYRYDQSLSVYDDGNNEHPVAVTKNNDGTYSFQYKNTDSTTGDYATYNIRARFTNQMKSHNLTISKAVSDLTDTTTDFTFQVLFKFGEYDYMAYPLNCTVGSSNTSLSADGKITVKPGQIVSIPKIPENAQIKIVEVLDDATSEYRYDSTTLKRESGTSYDKTDITKGITFNMGDENLIATISNTKQYKLDISHVLSKDTAQGAGANCTVKAEVLNPAGTDVEHTYAETTGTIHAGDGYIQQTENLLRITLKTAPEKFCELQEVRANADSDGNEITNSMTREGASVTVTTNANEGTYGTYTYVVTIKLLDLFNSDGSLKTNVLPFFSVLTLPEYKYEITYNYTSYRNNFGQQSYTVKGKFTQDELNTYMARKLNADLAFETNELKTQFVSNKAPYEDDFMKTISYQNASISGRGWSKDDYTIKLTVDPQEQENKICNINFLLPYHTTNEDKNLTVDGVTAEKIGTEDGKDNYNTLARTAAYLNWYVLSGSNNQTAFDANPENTPVFVKAPLKITEGTTNYYFMYWTVTTDGKYGSEDREYTRCYDPEFNLSIFQDCTITPIYSTTANQPENAYTEYKKFDPDVQKNLDTANGITITFIENSRNQYNYGNSGSITNVNRQGAGDRIYSDFLLSYNNVADGQKLMDLPENTMKAGIIIETVADLDKNGDKYVVDTEKNYQTKYGETISEANITKFTNYITSGTRPSGCDKTEFDVKQLDNKNRIQYYYSLANRAHVKGNGNTGDDTLVMSDEYAANNHKVFRAYAYIYTVGEGGAKENIKISETPAYFTINQIGSLKLGETPTN